MFMPLDIIISLGVEKIFIIIILIVEAVFVSFDTDFRHRSHGLRNWQKFRSAERTTTVRANWRRLMLLSSMRSLLQIQSRFEC